MVCRYREPTAEEEYYSRMGYRFRRIPLRVLIEAVLEDKEKNNIDGIRARRANMACYRPEDLEEFDRAIYGESIEV